MSMRSVCAIFPALSVIILVFAIQAAADESLGTVRGRLLDGEGAPVAGKKVAVALEKGSASGAVTAEDGTFALKAVIGRKSVKFKIGLNLFGLTSKTQQKQDIRVREVELEIGEGRDAASVSVPVFFASLPMYAVYLYDVIVPADGPPQWIDAGFFELDGVNLSSNIVKERDVITVEVPVRVPPYAELAAGMRVTVRGGIFGDKGLKAFDDGKKADKTRGDGVYTAVHEVSGKGPFGFYVVSADVQLPELSAAYAPGEAWPVMYTTISTSEAGGRVERVTEIYSLGGVETGLSAEWYYYCRNGRGRGGFGRSMIMESEREFARQRWYGSFARAHLGRESAPLFVCRGMVEFRASVALRRTMERYDAGDFEGALQKLEDARTTAPDYESIPLWEGLVKYELGDLDGAIAAIGEAAGKTRDANLKTVLAELYREKGDSANAVRCYFEAFLGTKDPQILRSASHYLYEIGDYESAQRAFDSLKAMLNRSAYGYGFLMYGNWDFTSRFSWSSMRAEQYLFRDFAAPEASWQREMFEEAYIYGSLSGWKASRRHRPGAPAAKENAKKYSVMLRLAGEYLDAHKAAEQIGGAAGEFETALICLDIAAEKLESGEWATETGHEMPELREARERLLGALEDEPESAAGNYGLALAAYLAGNAGEARPYCEKAVELHPRLNQARFLLANICEEQGDLEAAIKQWQWFADDAPEGAVKILASEHLESLKTAVAGG